MLLDRANLGVRSSLNSGSLVLSPLLEVAVGTNRKLLLCPCLCGPSFNMGVSGTVIHVAPMSQEVEGAALKNTRFRFNEFERDLVPVRFWPWSISWNLLFPDGHKCGTLNPENKRASEQGKMLPSVTAPGVPPLSRRACRCPWRRRGWQRVGLGEPANYGILPRNT